MRPAYVRSFAPVTPCARSSTASLSTQGEASEATVDSAVHASPSANPRR